MPIVVRRHNPPALGRYQGYKKYLREDFTYSCVYCAIHENEFGGPRSFGVEHFRPQAKFDDLKTTYSNLMYACCVCNSFKRDDWPSNDPLRDGKGYLNPCEHDYEEHFALSTDFHISGKSAPAVYMIEFLFLNRRQLQKLRRDRDADRRYHEDVCELYKFNLNQLEERRSIMSAGPKREQLEEELRALRARFDEVIERWQKRYDPIYDLDDYH